jgi:hypothetical protein
MQRTTVLATAAVLLLACSFVLLTAAPSEAKKKIVSLGCTAKEIDASDPKLSACYAMQDEDVRKNRSILHVVACMGGVRHCCKSDNFTGALSNCKVIDRTAPAVGGTTGPGTPPLDPGAPTPQGPAAGQRPTTVSPN